MAYYYRALTLGAGVGTIGTVGAIGAIGVGANIEAIL